MEILIYTINTCMYCNLAKKLLNEKNFKFTEINLENDPSIFKTLIEKTKQKTVPQIFIDKKFIGGYQELIMFFEEK